MKNMIDARGNPHGLINVLPNSVRDKEFSQFKEKDRESMKKLKAKEEKLVKARYVHRKGGMEDLCKPYMHWAGDDIRMYRFVHNNVYEVPQGLIDEVNANPGLAKRSEIVDSSGQPTIRDGMSEKDHSFYPAEF